MAFGYRTIDPIGVEVPACLISAALQTYRSNVSDLPHCRRILTFMLTAWLRERAAGNCLVSSNLEEKVP
jgi:hypothetical protein